MLSERVQRRIDGLLDDADEALSKQDWQRAAEICQAALVLDAENRDAQSFLSAAHKALAERDDESAFRPIDPPSEVVVAPDPTDQPTSFANGRYEVKRLLGEGGKKKVYLAHDTTLDRDVAFGLIKAEDLDADSRQRITREAQAMARLGDHPNLMPIFDLGDENGQPFMVQPLMGGGDVEALIEEAEDGRLTLENALRITSEICRGLEFAHGKGIIHRDLKPGNIWLTDDGTARIGDFGLALTLDRSRLTQESMMIGTVSYMPPEQATGVEATARSDLYSLGAMLYEMATGRPPFLGDDEIAIIGQHVNTPPVAPAWHDPEVPAQLDALIMRLLAKDPAERPESAGDVLTAIGEIDLTVTGPHENNNAGSLDSMAGGVFVGRQREMDQLKSEMEKALSGRGGMVTLVGEPGSGKTRTALELETYAGLRKAQVLWGHCHEEAGAPPYWPWVQAIRSYVRGRDPDALRSDMGSTASVIAEIVSDVKERLPDVESPPQIDDPDSARFRLFDSISTFLKSAAEVKPLVLILDDLHWADKPSLLLLEFVARELASSRIMLVGIYRDMELNRRHPLSVTLGDLGRERLFERVILRGISQADIRRFIEIAAGIDPPDGLVSSVFAQTEGNPLFVTETVRLFIQEGDLTPEKLASTDSWTVRTPEGVREAIGRRLDRLSEPTNDVLTTAAVLGRRFTLTQLTAIEDEISEDRLLDVLDEALGARVLEEFPEEIGRYQFTHALIQRTLGDELSTTRRVRLHARIAESLEALYGEDADDYAAELSVHFAEAETILGNDKLVHYLVVAGNTALASLAFEQAMTHFERAINTIGEVVDSIEKADAHAGFGIAGMAILFSSERRPAYAAMATALTTYESVGDGERAFRMVAAINDGFDPERLGPTLIARTIALIESDSVRVGRLLSLQARMLVIGSDRIIEATEIEPILDQAHAIALNHSDQRLLARVNADRAVYRVTTGSYDLSNDAADAALRINESIDDNRLSSEITGIVAIPAIELGDLQLAKRHAARGFAAAEATRIEDRVVGARSIQFAIAVVEGEFEVASREHNEIGQFGAGGQLKQACDVTICYLREGSKTGDAHLGELAERALTDEAWDQGHRAMSQYLVLACLRYELLGEWYLPADPGDLALNGLTRFEPTYGQGLTRILRAIHQVDRDELILIEEHLKHISITFTAQSLTTISGLRARVYAALDRADEARPYFERRIQQCKDAGYRTYTPVALCHYAEALAASHAPGDREKVTELQDEVIAIATDLGMKPLLERVLAQREILRA